MTLKPCARYKAAQLGDTYWLYVIWDPLSKPDPEPFLTAAERLERAPADCLVFEDTEMGIQAATAAGMASVKIPQPWQRIPVK